MESQSSYLRETPCEKIQDLFQCKDMHCIVCFISETKFKKIEDLLWFYSTDDCYEEINTKLRNQSDLDRVEQAFVLGMAFTVRRPVQELPDVVYRGLNLTQGHMTDYENSLGKQIYFYGFTSTTIDQKTAKKFGNTLMIITLQKGNRMNVAKIGGIAHWKNEKEVLISCNSGFQITKVDSFMKVIYLTLMDEAFSAPEITTLTCKQHGLSPHSCVNDMYYSPYLDGLRLPNKKGYEFSHSS